MIELTFDCTRCKEELSDNYVRNIQDGKLDNKTIDQAEGLK